MANTPKLLLLITPITILLSLSTLFSLSLSQPLEFSYNGFNSSNLVLTGATVLKPSGALRLTNKSQNIIGHAFYPTPIPMFTSISNSNNNNVSSFSTYFVFQISPSRPNNGGYGFAFVLSPRPEFDDPSPGHLLGVFNPSNDRDPSNHIFVVEFDTVNGYNEGSDSEGNHVGINVNGMNSTYSSSAQYYVDGTQARTEEFNLERAGPIQAWIDYNGSTNTINLTISPLNVPKPIQPLISEPIDLSSVVTEQMYVGFSASTGEKSSSHYILGWSFRLNGPAGPLDLGHLPVVPSDNFSSSKGIVRTALIATLSVVLFILMAILVGTLFYRKFIMSFEVLEDWELESPHRFRHADLHKATGGFKESAKIGSGGFGSVYKGVLPSTGSEIAVKRIKSNNELQGMKEFVAEIESLGRLRHKNLVNLQGWCKYKNDLLLVYDYVPNGSLDSLLYGSKNIRPTLTWEQRFNIVKGVASGLVYLHEEWEKVVIHRDVKSSNVLIDRDMNPKLGDFGLARLYDHEKTAHTTNVVGTIGYIAPELTRTGKASKGTDVFAYGILLLEVACGRGPVVYEADRNVILVDWVAECVNRGDLFGAVDVRLGSDYCVEEMELVLGLGLLCSHARPEKRPNMREVVKYLNGDEALPLFEKLSSAASRRVDEITSRFLALGLTDSVVLTSATTVSFRSCSVGAMSSASFDSGR
ncbi:concanavalin A-like lectin protein kinase family protein [Striga asiatica]|uniref:non-specific serine/threonine protein kinase n=1 Tax=Striga asiatica TaxID=4170 RepID=A0A5A7PYH4_STRAF|nr:concanavalin A-like lectin protein kinase family protein [Striga asiatica]